MRLVVSRNLADLHLVDDDCPQLRSDAIAQTTTPDSFPVGRAVRRGTTALSMGRTRGRAAQPGRGVSKFRTNGALTKMHSTAVAYLAKNISAACH
jgi:hypothetical protein